MGITERQEKILNSVIQEYIKRARPISSELLQRKYKLDICPATVRIEMQKLTDSGFLYQPHTSAGRIPTNRAYRFFVNNFLKNEVGDSLFFDVFEEIKIDFSDNVMFMETISNTLASFSSTLVFTYWCGGDLLLKEGWKNIFQNPEFKEKAILEEFIETVERVEKEIKKLESLTKTEVYIGREKSFLSSEGFSLIVSKTRFPQKESGVFALLGPNRMPYDKNISLVNSLIKTLKEKESYLENDEKNRNRA